MPVEELLTRVTLDIIGVSLLGKELRDFRSQSSPLSFEQCYNAILAQPVAGQIISFINPFIPLRWLPVSANLDFIHAKIALKTMMAELIEQRTAEVAAAKKREGEDELADDLLTRMIEASAEENQRLSREELIDIVSARNSDFRGFANPWARSCRLLLLGTKQLPVLYSGQYTHLPRTLLHKIVYAQRFNRST